jgi:phosphoribosylaminoimidazolecarboxamide formyltransferase/IMP cyclohydrolase
MGDDLKQMYRTVMDDHFAPRMEISFVDGDNRQTLVYEKVAWTIAGLRKGLRYGENPGQEAALYRPVNGNLVVGEVRTILPGNDLVSDIELLQSGKHPGKTNLTDADSALNILRFFTDRPTVVIVKHNNPCGVARAERLADAYRRAFLADRVAAFGGCIALNRAADRETAEAIAEQYAEVVAAPEFEEGTLDILGRRKNLRVIRIGNMQRLQRYVGQRCVEFKSLMDGGLVAQLSFAPRTLSAADFLPARCTHGGKVYQVLREPSPAEREDLLFGWLVECGVTSNSVIYVKNQTTVGIGTGEQDRVGVAEIARDKAYRKLADRYSFEAFQLPFHELADPERRAAIQARVASEKGGLIGSAMVSDAFFPFRDGIDVGLREGVAAVVQPGGSENDYQSIEACNAAGAAMVFTGQRCFRH